MILWGLLRRNGAEEKITFAVKGDTSTGATESLLLKCITFHDA
jgi:hypothetical protein